MYLAVLLIAPMILSAQSDSHIFSIESPKSVISGLPSDICLAAYRMRPAVDTSFSQDVRVYGLLRYGSGEADSAGITAAFHQGRMVLRQVVLTDEKNARITLEYQGRSHTENIRVIPGYFSLLPPLLAILLALIFRQVLVALFSGIWLGATFLWGYNPFTGLLRVLDHYMIQSLLDPDHVAIVLFSMMLGGMVGILSHSGGTQGIVRKLSRWAGTPARGQFITWLMGLFIFFDDYANTLLVGNTMRSFTDRLRISREKLAYLVDSTAAPVTSLAVLSTWIGFELGLMQSAFNSLGLDQNVYFVFLQTIPYRFYSLFTIIFVFLIAVVGRDFGPMLKAERRARRTGRVLSEKASPLFDAMFDQERPTHEIPYRWFNAVIPVLVVIFITMAGLYFDGRMACMASGMMSPGLRDIAGAANPFPVLMWASFFGTVTAAVLALLQRILNLRQTVNAWIAGCKSMLIAMIILVLAWGIGQICMDLHTADYIIEATRGLFSPVFMPLLTFVIAALISFATGTSWGTMSILVPIVIPLAYQFTRDASMAPDISHAIFVGTLASVLSGAVFGDHCSPISDTTIMSSMSSGADHVDHVRTQIPYAVLVALVSIFVGYLPLGLGLKPILSLPLGIFFISGLLLILGHKTDHL